MKLFTLLCASLILPASMALAQMGPGEEEGKVVIMGGFSEDTPPRVGVTGGGGMIRTGNPTDWNHKQDPSLYIKEIDPVVSLTDDQKKAITDIYAERTRELTDYSAANKDKFKSAGEALINAYQSNDQEAQSKAQQDYQLLYDPMQKITKKYGDKLNKVLTGEQKNKLKDAVLTDKIKAVASPVQLTEQQMRAVKAAVKEVEDQPQNWPAIAEAVDNVITPAEAEVTKTRSLRVLKPKYYAANLTAEQLQQLETTAAQLAKDPNFTVPDIVKELAQKADSLLTADQKKAMEDAAKPAGKRQ